MPLNPPSDGDVLTATLLLSDVWNQVVGTVTSGTRPAGTEGQVIYETDTDLFKAFLSSWVDFGGLGAWQVWTPTVTQSGAVAVTTNYGVYYKLGRRVKGQCVLTCTGTGVANNVVSVSMPGGFTAVGAAGVMIGTGMIRDASATANAPGFAWISATGGIALVDSTQTTNNLSLGQTGALFAAALTTNDIIRLDVEFETTA